MIIILPNDVDGDDREDGGDDGGGGRDDGGRRYFPTYFSSFHFLFLSFLDFSPSFFLLFFVSEFQKNLHKDMEEFLVFEESM